jgi:hypothetical protein
MKYYVCGGIIFDTYEKAISHFNDVLKNRGIILGVVEIENKQNDKGLKMAEFYEDVEDILDSFDFAKVKSVMEFLDWHWFDAENGVPNISELRKKARKLLNDVRFNVVYSKEFNATSTIATGGFQASAQKYDDSDKIYMKLVFQLAECDNYE